MLARQANKDGTVTADFGESTTWGDDDSSVFVVSIITDGWILRSLFGGIPNNDLMVTINPTCFPCLLRAMPRKFPLA